MKTIKGEFTGNYSFNRRGFTYWFICPQCSTRFMETSPELTVPTLCHACSTKSDRGFELKVLKSRRKGKSVGDE